MDILIALVPPIFAGIALYFILRWINRADRSERAAQREAEKDAQLWYCLLYTSDAADDMQCVDLGGRRIIKKIFFKQKTAYEM